MLNPIIIFFWELIQIVIGYNLILPLIFFFFYLPIHFIKNKPAALQSVPENDYAIIVTAYQQTGLIPEVIDSILKLNYANFLVYIVADHCDVTDLHFNDDRVILLCPEKVIASNTGSHLYAIRHFKRNHKFLTIIDSDNLVHQDYLSELDNYFSLGYQAVQGIRKAKNLETNYAALDAARDLYYHFYDGKILFGLGSSATLSGSGMAFTTDLYKDCIKNTVIKGAGFDKALQYEIVKRGLRIAFAEKAIVYDEKTSQPEQLIKQRSRWINSWFKYFSNGFILLNKGIIHKSMNQFLFGIVLLRPPLFIFLILSLICLSINIAIDPFFAFIWLLALICFVLGFGISIVQKNTDPLIYRSLVNIPKFIFYQIISLLKVRSADKISVATEHSHKKNLDDLAN
jgi:cellulose synthase/poly-beta-1,6-N-acetylglucosamine synthase-like glycosyltransferase